MIKLVTDKAEYTKAWEAKQMDLLQSWQWGEIKRPEFEPMRLVINDIPISILVKKTSFLGLKYGYMPRAFGLVAFSCEDLKELIRYSKTNLGLVHLLIDPNLTDPLHQDIFNKAGFKSNGTTLQPNQTNMLDLNKTEEQLWLDLRPSSRRNVNKAMKNGCKIETFTNGEDVVKRFFAVNSQINARRKYQAYPFEYYKKVWDILSPLNMARIYIVTSEGKDIGAFFVANTKTKLYELYGGVDDTGKALKAGHLLKWHSIQEAKKLGLKDYDQWGVAPLLKAKSPSVNEQGPQPSSGELLTKNFDQNDKLAYISEFKFSFGGTYIQFLPQQLYVFNPIKYFIYKAFKRLKKS